MNRKGTAAPRAAMTARQASRDTGRPLRRPHADDATTGQPDGTPAAAPSPIRR